MEPDAWGRNRLLATLSAAAAVALLVSAGLVYAVIRSLNPGPDYAPHRGAAASSDQRLDSSAHGQRRREEITAQPMLHVTSEAMMPTTPTTQLAKTLLIPESTGTGPAGVLDGFPHTAQGAIGQVAAIGSTVIGSMSIDTAHQVYDAWAMPGGAGPRRWQMTTNVASFLAAANMGSAKARGASVTAVPAAAQVKGTDGPDWVVGCVLFEVDATVNIQSSIGYGYCERMQWKTEPTMPQGGRWMIAPGTQPAPAPNTWPGSAVALHAGWHTWATPAHPDASDPAAADAPDNNPANP